MSVQRAKPLLATVSGQDITDRLDSTVRELAVFSPPLEKLLEDIIVRLDILIEYQENKNRGFGL